MAENKDCYGAVKDSGSVVVMSEGKVYDMSLKSMREPYTEGERVKFPTEIVGEIKVDHTASAYEKGLLVSLGSTSSGSIYTKSVSKSFAGFFAILLNRTSSDSSGDTYNAIISGEVDINFVKIFVSGSGNKSLKEQEGNCASANTDYPCRIIFKDTLNG